MSKPVPPFDPANVQGDILVGLPKKVQHYLFFQIGDDITTFRKRLAQLVPLITSTTDAQEHRAKIAAHKKMTQEQGSRPKLLKISGINIAFSHSGLTKLGIADDSGDTGFEKGQLADASHLGDPGSTVNGTFVPDWVPAFKNPVHGVILFSGDSEATISASQAAVSGIFNVGRPTLREVITLKGNVRPGDQKGHEHFGFLDGISQPAIKGFDTNPNPGQQVTRQGVILCGREGDIHFPSNIPVARPSWALDGSFLALRYYFQLVPEFNAFLKNNPIVSTGLTREQGSELLGARLVGRWKSGAPIDLFPLQDNPEAGADPLQNDNFTYNFPEDSDTQDRCPFAAHTRKTNARKDLWDEVGFVADNGRIIRRGIPFGPEVTPEEAASGKTKHGRGLIFVAYQSNMGNGFRFEQHNWANDVGFPRQKPITPGYDPIIGQAPDPTSRTVSGTDPKDQSAALRLPTQWVIPKGGEYFFSPSIPALRDTFALSAIAA